MRISLKFCIVLCVSKFRALYSWSLKSDDGMELEPQIISSLITIITISSNVTGA